MEIPVPPRHKVSILYIVTTKRDNSKQNLKHQGMYF